MRTEKTSQHHVQTAGRNLPSRNDDRQLASNNVVNERELLGWTRAVPSILVRAWQGNGKAAVADRSAWLLLQENTIELSRQAVRAEPAHRDTALTDKVE